ncbi:D-sedoheptulose 7-phosphate isomerase [Desulfoplanes formicivorans]|uniref:Phosphoheptose isomerase n=1 Tax=Desulfoplanes formicivorans TaxID=1592317 RepID=A0A194AGI2_9BACT|nr:D-sedoheptulose 7-phosphate isomerase [Desulfoplanes formicivorans]GAU09182.1 phosphoheptose isomerase [Desulfoplanes formicivorans]
MEDRTLTILKEHAEAGATLRQRFFERNADLLAEIAKSMAVTMAREGKILLCGNGGSAADCQHIAAEFTNRFLLERPPLPALSLTTDTSALTAIGNDYGFDQVFEKQLRALGRTGDVLVAISTSGNSANIVNAVQAAREMGIVVVGLSGRDGGAMAPLCDYLLLVEDRNTPLIQEIHIAAGHLLCRLVDYYLFENVALIQPYLGG